MCVYNHAYLSFILNVKYKEKLSKYSTEYICLTWSSWFQWNEVDAKFLIVLLLLETGGKVKGNKIP